MEVIPFGTKELNFKISVLNKLINSGDIKKAKKDILADFIKLFNKEFIM